MARARLLALIVALAALAACADAQTLEDTPCPPAGTKLTYDNFGRSFLGTYCQTCHGMPETERKGAPASFDFGSLDAVRAHKSRIFVRAAGPNTTMPPGPDDPPRADRDELAEWLACGAP